MGKKHGLEAKFSEWDEKIIEGAPGYQRPVLRRLQREHGGLLLVPYGVFERALGIREALFVGAPISNYYRWVSPETLSRIRARVQRFLDHCSKRVELDSQEA